MAGRGKAAPDRVTQQRLFCASGGYCQNPRCHAELFKATENGVVHIAEMAHVFAANAEGPRPPGEMSEEERGAFENLIVLCSSCHTEVDKAEQNYPPEVLLDWKASHQASLQKTFGAERYANRADVRQIIEPLLAKNRALFEALNPNLPYSQNPESEIAGKWQTAVRSSIIPNNRRVLAILDTNRYLMNQEEKTVLEEFRQHIDDMALRHLTDVAPPDQRRFPVAMDTMMTER